MPRQVAILMFDHVEVLDFCGPFEVFSVTGRRDGAGDFDAFTVAEKSPVLARNQLSVNPHFVFPDCPRPDIVVVPGGGGYDAQGNPFGSRREMNNRAVLDWLQKVCGEAEIVLSVCTGALILARAGLLTGLNATTHHLSLTALEQVAPQTTVLADQRVVDNGKIITAAGISAGLDAALHVVARLFGVTKARETATYMEYEWRPM